MSDKFQFVVSASPAPLGESWVGACTRQSLFLTPLPCGRGEAANYFFFGMRTSTPFFFNSASKISLILGSSSSYSIKLPPLRVLVLPRRCVRPPPPNERMNHLPSPPQVGAM